MSFAVVCIHVNDPACFFFISFILPFILSFILPFILSFIPPLFCHPLLEKGKNESRHDVFQSVFLKSAAHFKSNSASRAHGFSPRGVAVGVAD